MSDVGQVVAQMVERGMPALPANHPLINGKFNRFGPGKKAWYKFTDVTLKSGRRIISGSFGIYQGLEPNTIKLQIDYEPMSDEERSEFAGKQREAERALIEAAKRAAQLAANRARNQWNKAANLPLDHPYLVRKQVPALGVRVSAGGLLLVPLMRDGQLAGLQKIDADGGKKLNQDMDAIGVMHALGQLDGADVIAVGEGYATCASARISVAPELDLPVAVGLNAGNLGHVAKLLRRQYPAAHLLLLADDDCHLSERLVAYLLERFKVSAPVPIDGASHLVLADDGAEVRAMATWCTDPQGVRYIDADVRSGRRLLTPTFKNAGVATCMALAAELGNASVATPVFADRGGRKLSDFNDLHVEEGLAVVGAQIALSILAAQQHNCASPTPGEDVDDLYAQAVDVVLKYQRASISLVQRHLRIGYNRAARLLEQMEGSGVVSPQKSNGDRDILVFAIAPAAAAGQSPVAVSLPAAQQPKTASPALEPAQAGEHSIPAVGGEGADVDSPRPPDAECDAVEGRPAIDGAASASNSPPPSKADAAPVMTGIFSVEWAVAHCALVQGSTDVWDSLNKLRMKRGAFIDMVGKDGAKEWTSHPDRRAISPRNLPKTVRGVASQDGGAGGDNIVMMLDRYTLLYGTKTVFDAEKRSIIAYDAMALARGNDLASRWISHPLHMEKDYDKVVFDPTQRVDLNTHINLFEGFPLKPRTDEAKAGLVLDLLWSLCSTESNREEVFRWVLRWLAYPLQNPGAKMQSALLFFGEKQGTGKSLFFEGIVKPIYGAHGATGGQHQLEGTYTMWRSQKLFVLFEEILSRQDKYSYFGLIKHMITGRDTPISQKFKDDRVEANHMNVVMLSNEFQAIPLEPEDRRFLVVDVRQLLDEALLAKIKAGLGDGLVEAFYGFLLAYPLDGFDPHTKPLMTSAKERVINFGRPDWESFFLAWSGGELAAPWCSCLSTDLYLVFSRYASKYGLRSMSMTKFAEMIAQRVKKDRQWVGFGQSTKRLLNVFHVPYVPADGDVPESGRPGTISEQCAIFRDVADVRSDL